MLLIGIDPKYLDYSLVPGVDEPTLTAGLETALSQVIAAGLDAEWCLTDVAWEPAQAQISARLAAKRFAVIMIGAGIRVTPAYFLLFEQIINLVHTAAAAARLCFNTSPDSTRDAVLRWAAR